jgi:DNA gyrase subunit A
MYTEKEKLQPTSITDIMQTAYIDYSMSVIISRALPDVRDGLKPVQRRILYAMLREGLLHNRATTKCAGVVGEVLKTLHPHGDSSVYDTLVRMAQTWIMGYPLVDPQGNFGSVDGDPPAAYRYTECRLTAIAEELLRDIDEDTVDFGPNYDEKSVEPLVLPAALPGLLMNGSTGIAVGMTTNIPPHNLGELIDAICAIMDNPKLSMDELIKLVPGPDFPTGGTIAGRDGIESYLRTGRGIVRVRGACHTEELKGGKEQIVITEIPYNVNRSVFTQNIASLIHEKTIDEVSDLRDESDENTRIVLELKRGEPAKVVVNKLYKHTQFETSFGVILLALDKRRPKQMNIRELMDCYVEHRRDVVTRRTKFLLRKVEDRAHILEGYQIALSNLDDIVKIIRAAPDRDEARTRLMAKYPLSERQTNAILDLRLYQLTGLERDKIKEEYKQLMALAEEYREILRSEKKLLGVIKKELRELKDKFPSPRRTKLVAAEGELKMEDVIANEGCIVTVSHMGFIKRTAVSAYRSQKRGGKGVIGTGQHDEDFVEHLFTASTHDYMMFFTSNGRVYVEKVYEIPEGTRTSKGRAISNVVQMLKEEKIAAMVCVKSLEEEGKFLMFCTQNGIIKKTELKDYANVRKGGIIAINIEPGDTLIAVKEVVVGNQVVLISSQGMSIRFPEDDARPMGRPATGVIGMRLDKGDMVKAMEVVDPACTLLVAGVNGIGKRTPFDDEDGPVYRLQSRGGSGVIAIKTESGVCGALSVRENDEVMMLTASGQAVRSPVKDIRTTGRVAQGVRLVRLETGDKLVGLCKVIETEAEDDEAGEEK